MKERQKDTNKVGQKVRKTKRQKDKRLEMMA
jgi:hypothetical protein